MDIVQEVLSKDKRTRAEASESIKVSKLVPLECYPRDLLVIDTNEINLPEFRKDKEGILLNLSKDCVQHLLNTLSDYPKETKDDKVFLQVPGFGYSLPREKPVPTPKPLTKWQKFANEKGIGKKKKPRTTWDDILQRWVPTYGYQKAAADREKNWVLEVPSNVDPNTDMFAEMSKTKKENIAKNEYQRLRNIAASRKVKVPKVAVPPMEGNLHVAQLQVAADVARLATASVGKFQPKLPQEKDLKQPKNLGNKKKRPLLNTDEEKNQNLAIATKVLNKKPKLDITKAVNKHIHEEQTQRREEKSAEKKKGKKRKWTDSDGKKGKSGKNSFKRPKGGKGQRAGGKQKGGGRKRR